MTETAIGVALLRPRQRAASICAWVSSFGIQRLLATLIAAVVSGLAYRSASNRDEVGWLELAAGVVAALLIVFCCLLWARKRVSAKSRWSIGSVPSWRRMHYWAGSLIVPLVFWHSGLRCDGRVEKTLITLVVAVVSSGVIGFVVQRLTVLRGE